MTAATDDRRQPCPGGRKSLVGLASAAGLVVALSAPLAGAADAAPVEYNRDIRPILAENCFTCHGPDSAARKADLRLDVREKAVESGSIVPGDPGASSVIERLETADKSQLMPPPKTNKKLTPREKDLLKRWVAAGAPYQAHWSLLAPRRPAPPAVKNAGWVRTPVDAFVLAELEKRGLSPAVEADRRALARRLALDLTGLPPAPELVEKFVQDKSSDAYERLVDHLMSLPAWGEHRGRAWLDVARYADTHGIHFDNFREMWAYRDWVIGAFSKNMPFDQFTREQLAGDLLPNATLDQVVASGFNRCNITTSEGGAISEEYLVLYTRDRTETVSQVWLGMTANCAVCHDHKFDPLTMRDFYSMAAFFNNTTQAAMDGNVKDTPPVLPLPRPEDRPRFELLGKEIASLRPQVEARRLAARKEFEGWLSKASAGELMAKVPGEGQVFAASLNEGKGQSVSFTTGGKTATVTAKAALAWAPGHVAAQALKSQPGNPVAFPRAGDFEKDGAFSAAAWVKLDKAKPNGPVVARMDEGQAYRGWDVWVENNRFGSHLIHKWQDDAIKVVARNPVKPDVWSHVVVTYDGSGKAAGLKVYVNGAAQETEVQADGLKNTMRTSVPLTVGHRTGKEHLGGALVQDLRLYGRALAAGEVEALARGTRAAWIVGQPPEQRPAAAKDELFAWWLPAMDSAYRDLSGRLAALEQEQTALRTRGTVAHVMQERKEEAMAYILQRGEYDRRKDPVKPGTPKVLPPMPPELPRNRLGFAEWLLRPEHPLTARVTVNRYWQELFGTGLVRTAGDFGVSGEQPSHPELLDWLAVEFRESGWDVKRFFKMLVMSSAYRQAAVATAEKLQKDPQNRLLSRGPRFRLDGEVIRDLALASSGLLSPRLGGPSVKPYQPEGVWEAVAMIGSNTRDYRADSGENLYRRSLYTFWKRSAPPASLEIFNAPSRETCTVRRERTNTPLQALVTLNDPQFVEAARALAQKALKEGGTTPEARVDYVTTRLISRPLRPEERAVVGKSLAELLAFYQANPKRAAELVAVGESKADPALDPKVLAGWTMLVNQLMNLDEVLCK